MKARPKAPCAHLVGFLCEDEAAPEKSWFSLFAFKDKDLPTLPPFPSVPDKAYEEWTSGLIDALRLQYPFFKYERKTISEHFHYPICQVFTFRSRSVDPQTAARFAADLRRAYLERPTSHPFSLSPSIKFEGAQALELEALTQAQLREFLRRRDLEKRLTKVLPSAKKGPTPPRL